MHSRILVTGGAGFVGSNLAIALKRRWPGATLLAFDNLHRRGSEQNLPRLQREGVVFVHGDIRSPDDLSAIRPAPDLIVECSAEPSAQAGYAGSPAYLVGANLTGCFHCLDLARRAKADFIFLSTGRVYPFRRLNELPFTETETRYRWSAAQTFPGVSEHGISEHFPLDGPRSLYGMTKLAAELMVEEFADAYGIRFLIDRFGLLAGPWQMAKSDQGVLTLWMGSHYFGRNLSYIGFGGTGKQVRDILHIDDFCDLLLDQVEHFTLYCGRRFNVGGGAANSLSLREATNICAEITGNSPPISASLETRPADVRIYISDHREVSAINNWRPRRDAHTVLRDIHQWLQAEGKQLESILL